MSCDVTSAAGVSAAGDWNEMVCVDCCGDESLDHVADVRRGETISTERVLSPSPLPCLQSPCAASYSDSMSDSFSRPPHSGVLLCSRFERAMRFSLGVSPLSHPLSTLVQALLWRCCRILRSRTQTARVFSLSSLRSKCCSSCCSTTTIHLHRHPTPPPSSTTIHHLT